MEDTWLFIVGALMGAVVATLIHRTRRPLPDVADPSVAQVPEPTSEASTLLELLSEGVIVLNDVLRPVISNASARRLLRMEHGVLPPDEVMSVARRALTTGSRAEETVDLWNPDRTSVLVGAEALEDDGGVLVTLRDISSEQRALRLRRQFVSHASHELKSPIASIQTLAEAISQAAPDDADAVEGFARKMLIETARVGKLVADLLDLSRMEDPSGFRHEAVDVSEVARKLAEEAQQRATTKRLHFERRIEDSVWTQGDERQLSLLIRNLLDNAIRYTPEEGSVTLEVGREDDQAVVVVSDDGIGIPLKSQARVFERFYRVDEGRSRDQGGTGLGLAIVKHVADLYSGRVELRSEFGEGSTFTVYLPATAPSVVEDGTR